MQWTRLVTPYLCPAFILFEFDVFLGLANPQGCELTLDLLALEADNAETWLVKCFPYNSSTCCLQGGDTCCGDSSSIFFKYDPGTVVALLDTNGNNTMVQSSTGSTATGSTSASSTSTTTSSPSSSSSGQAGTTSQSHTAEIALGVVLGVVIIAAIFGITALWMKLRSETGRRQRAETELDAIRGTSAAFPQQIADNNANKAYPHQMAAQDHYPAAQYPAAQYSSPQHMQQPMELPAAGERYETD